MKEKMRLVVSNAASLVLSAVILVVLTIGLGSCRFIFPSLYIDQDLIEDNLEMIAVAGGIASPIGMVERDYELMEGEVSYALWYTVSDWAEKNGYSFTCCVRQGSEGGVQPVRSSGFPGSFQAEPAARVSWADAIIWCNALTAWHNETRGTSYTPAYYLDANLSEPILDDSNEELWVETMFGTRTEPYIDPDATGFRLPHNQEWYFALLFVADLNEDGDADDPDEFVAANTTDTSDNPILDQTLLPGYSNSFADNVTRPIKSVSNQSALGFYDMAGNIAELGIDWNGHEIIAPGSGEFINGRSRLGGGVSGSETFADRTRMAPGAVYADGDGSANTGLRVARWPEE